MTVFQSSDFEKIDRYYSKSRKKQFTFKRLKNISQRNKQFNENYQKSLQEQKFSDQEIPIPRNKHSHQNSFRGNTIQPPPPPSRPIHNKHPNYNNGMNNIDNNMNPSMNESQLIPNQANKLGHHYRTQKKNDMVLNQPPPPPAYKKNLYQKDYNTNKDNFQFTNGRDIVFVENSSSKVQDNPMIAQPPKIYKNDQVINPNFYQEINNIKKRSFQEMNQQYINKNNEKNQIQNENRINQEIKILKPTKNDNSTTINEIQFKTMNEKPQTRFEKVVVNKPNGNSKKKFLYQNFFIKNIFLIINLLLLKILSKGIYLFQKKMLKR